MHVNYIEVCKISEVLKEYGDDNLVRCFEDILKDYDKIIKMGKYGKVLNVCHTDNRSIWDKIQRGHKITLKDLENSNGEGIRVGRSL